MPFGRPFAEPRGSEHVWYFAEEIFLKAGGHGTRSPWHGIEEFVRFKDRYLPSRYPSWTAVGVPQLGRASSGDQSAGW
ncbi:hypothetical protein ACFVT2_26740 [Streptomyces sp. NPDC058000]|uniref:hypothetical protein n=1 Tax=Streptomyces sp. NPDC058000 TaxID=3346299 RepID=UPI0036F055B6